VEGGERDGEELEELECGVAEREMVPYAVMYHTALTYSS
jgi:hypothetical protein